jgi:hypothetical protein
MSEITILDTLIDTQQFNLDDSVYDTIAPKLSLSLAFKEPEKLKKLSQELWKVEPNHEKIYSCLQVIFASPIYQSALQDKSPDADFPDEMSCRSSPSDLLFIFSNYSKEKLIECWKCDEITFHMQCLNVIIKNAIPKGAFMKEMQYLLFMRPQWLHEIAMCKQMPLYHEAKEYLNTIEIDWFFGKVRVNRNSLHEFHQRLKEHKDIYGYFLGAVRTQTGLGKKASEEEINKFLETADIKRIVSGMLHQIEKDPVRAKRMVKKLKKVLKEIIPDDLKASLSENAIFAKAMNSL